MPGISHVWCRRAVRGELSSGLCTTEMLLLVLSSWVLSSWADFCQCGSGPYMRIYSDDADASVHVQKVSATERGREREMVCAAANNLCAATNYLVHEMPVSSIWLGSILIKMCEKNRKKRGGTLQSMNQLRISLLVHDAQISNNATCQTFGGRIGRIKAESSTTNEAKWLSSNK